MKRRIVILLSILIITAATNWHSAGIANSLQEGGTRPHEILPGDTWTALSLRYHTEPTALQAAYGHLNRQQEPIIGSTISVPITSAERTGRLVRPYGGVLGVAVEGAISPWRLARQNGLASPYRPALHRPLLVSGPQSLQELPSGFATLELSQLTAVPGQALGLRARLTQSISPTISLAAQLFISLIRDDRLVSLIGTGAFFPAGTHDLAIEVEGHPPWTQPWRFVDGEWVFQDLTLTGSAAEIDQASIEEERARLMAIWTQVTPWPQWTAPFDLPIQQYLEISAPYGARRSYNGGPYRTYHEGVDFSAYGGTPVFAPAAGMVVLAEPLFVRGGAVIINHGLGVYSGYYHLSSVSVSPGQQLQPGDPLGEVGTTGLSTGNHLHWDLLINGVWVNAAAWRERDLASWILEGWGQGEGVTR